MSSQDLMSVLVLVAFLAGIWALHLFFPNSGEYDREETLAMLKDSKVNFNAKVLLYLQRIHHGEESGYYGHYQIRNNGYVIYFSIPLTYFHNLGSLSNDFEKNLEVKLPDVLEYFNGIQKDGEETVNSLWIDDEFKKELGIGKC